MSRVSRRSLGNKPWALTLPVINTGGGGGGGGTPGALPAFTLRNWGGSTTPGFARIGLAFKKGDVPSSMIPALSRGTLQLDARSFWSDGSLKHAVGHVRDTALTASEARSIQISAASGSYSNTGTLTLASVLSGHDFKVLFTSLTQYKDSTTVTRGSGAFTASLAAHAAVLTRVTKVHSGPVCEGWVVWGMATDNTGVAADAHLKTYWHIDAWKNADGSIAAIEICAVVAQDWWSVANKFRLNYDATFQDGASVIGTYAGVQHPYNSTWATVKTVADNNIGRRPWVGGAIPTLHYEVDQAYWISTGLISSSFDLTLSPSGYPTDGQVGVIGAPAAAWSGGLPTFVPCSNQDQRPGINGTGAYPGRGLITNIDALAFMRRTPRDTAIARVNAHAGLHVPYHYRSNNNRTRPGESADVASTIIALKLDNPNRATDWENCTSDGMPAPVHAYADSRTTSGYQDSYAGAVGGYGMWSIGDTPDASHAVPYSYFMYLLEGETFFLEATLDLATNCAHQNIGQGYSVRGLLLAGDSAYASLSIPTGTYAGLPGIWKPSNQRAIGLALNLLGCAAGVIPADHVAYNYMQKWVAQVGDWIGLSLLYMPTDQKAYGAFYPKSWLDGVSGQGNVPSWFMGLTALGAYSAFLMTEDTRYRDLGDCAANLPIGLFASGRNYMADQYHGGDRPKATDWNASTNRFYAPGNTPAFNLSASVNDHASGLIGMDLFEGGGQNQSGGWLTMTNGDQWSPSSFNGTVPPELTEGQVYYVRDVTVDSTAKNCTFKIATTAGGTPITFAANSSVFFTQWWPQDAVHPVAVNPPYIPPADSYAAINAAAVEMAKRCGNAAATPSIVAAERAFMAPVARAGWMPWALAA